MTDDAERPAGYAPNLPAQIAPAAAKLAGELEALAQGLPNPWDESTDYFRGFAAALPAQAPLDPAALHRALGLAATHAVPLAPAAPRLAALEAASDSWGEPIASGFRRLALAMTTALGELWIAHARCDGEVRVPLWLFGRVGDVVVGLYSISTET